MNQTSTRPDPDAVKHALEVLGDRWTFLILREAFFGVRRYGYFQRNLGIGRNVLAARLSALVEHGLLERVRYRTDPDWTFSPPSSRSRRGPSDTCSTRRTPGCASATALVVPSSPLSWFARAAASQSPPLTSNTRPIEPSRSHRAAHEAESRPSGTRFAPSTVESRLLDRLPSCPSAAGCSSTACSAWVTAWALCSLLQR
jgi:hypothetical protein